MCIDVVVTLVSNDFKMLLHSNFDYLIPDAPELVHDFLEREQDASCKRNAFMMLIHVDQVTEQQPRNTVLLFFTQ